LGPGKVIMPTPTKEQVLARCCEISLTARNRSMNRIQGITLADLLKSTNLCRELALENISVNSLMRNVLTRATRSQVTSSGDMLHDFLEVAAPLGGWEILGSSRGNRKSVPDLALRRGNKILLGEIKSSPNTLNKAGYGGVAEDYHHFRAHYARGYVGHFVKSGLLVVNGKTGEIPSYKTQRTFDLHVAGYDTWHLVAGNPSFFDVLAETLESRLADMGGQFEQTLQEKQAKIREEFCARFTSAGEVDIGKLKLAIMGRPQKHPVPFSNLVQCGALSTLPEDYPKANDLSWYLQD